MSTPVGYWTGTYCELPIYAEDTDAIPLSGPADDGVASRIDAPREWPGDDDIAKELKEYGAWDDDELKDAKANRERLLWIATLDIKEGTQDPD